MLLIPRGTPIGGDVPVPHLAKIADLLDDVVSELRVQPERLAKIALQAKQPADVGILGVRERIDVLTGDAFFLGRDHRREGPAHHVEPFVVALANHHAKRLFADDLGQQR